MTPDTLVDTDAGELLREVLQDHVGRPRRLVVLAMSKDENPKTTVMVLPERASAPTLAVKVAWTSGARAAVAAEAAALRQVVAADPGLVGDTVPRLIEERQDARGAVMVTTAQRGISLSVDYHRWRHTARPRTVEHDFRCAAGWLDRLALVPLADVVEAGESDALAPGAALARKLVARWPADPVALQLAERVRDSGALVGSGSSSSVVHGDFWCGNVLRRGGLVSGVIDWEHAAFGGDPVRDRVRFALSYALYLDRHTGPGRRVTGHADLVAGRWGEGVRYAMEGSGWFPRLVQAFVALGLQQTDRDPGLWRDALLVGLAEVAAGSDHEVFAGQHLALAASLSTSSVAPAGSARPQSAVAGPAATSGRSAARGGIP
ncbi:phosphotransferase [Terrabacter sp. C0L_2]|uniref:phosphotransferase n=1 Tax=Terrabacter sp. C0L_2 TaxID=3108389 RepID=UPI002ED0F947|nr:phosphotransferase [Terrabacter sp. C0L_2]